MNIFAGKSFKKTVEIISVFDSKSFRGAFEKIEKFSKTHYILGYIRYEAKDVFLGKDIS